MKWWVKLWWYQVWMGIIFPYLTNVFVLHTVQYTIYSAPCLIYTIFLFGNVVSQLFYLQPLDVVQLILLLLMLSPNSHFLYWNIWNGPRQTQNILFSLNIVKHFCRVFTKFLILYKHYNVRYYLVFIPVFFALRRQERP